MPFRNQRLREWVLGSLVACLLVWQAICVVHYDHAVASDPDCAVCSAVLSTPTLGSPPPVGVIVIALLVLLFAVQSADRTIFLARSLARTNQSRAPPAH